jgi:hypothetical protein
MIKHRLSIVGALLALMFVWMMPSPAAADVPPANDAFSSAQEVSGDSGFASGTNAGASKEASEPDHAGKPGGASVWYRWTPGRNGRATVSTCDSDFNTLLAVYTGTSVDALTPVASNDDACGLGSSVTFSAVGGTTYRIAVDGDAAASGDIGLRWFLGPTNDDFSDAQLLSGDSGAFAGTTVGATKELGEPDHAGNPGGASIWYRWVAPSNGPMTIDTCDSDFDTTLAVYTGTSVAALTAMASNDDACGALSRVSFLAVAGAAYDIAVDGYYGEWGDVAGGWSRTAIAPEALTVPTVSGETRDGATLSATTGAWSGTPPIAYAFEWVRCDASGSNCRTIPGATAQTYTLGSADVGSRMRIFVTASNSVGSSYVNSAATNIVAPVPPSNASAPTVEGSAKVGETLSANTGDWRGTAPLTFSYQWQRCDRIGGACTDLSGETSPDFTLDTAAVGSTIRVAVTAANAVGSASAVSSPAGPVRALPRCVVPRVTGKSLARARRAIVRAHCKVGAVTRARSTRVKKGHVISQRPRPGTRRAKRRPRTPRREPRWRRLVNS